MRLLGWDANAEGVFVGEGWASQFSMGRTVADRSGAICEQVADRGAHHRDSGDEAVSASVSCGTVVDVGG